MNRIKTIKLKLLFLSVFLMSLSTFVSPANAATVGVDVNDKKQTIVGIGGALAMYTNWFVAHPNKQEIYDSLFSGLGISFLRIRDDWKHSEDTTKLSGAIPIDSELVAEARKRLGNTFHLYMSSWTPPSYLKSNNKLAGEDTATLAKVNGQYNYAGFGNYWKETIQGYSKVGMWPEYISIQNEPDWGDQNEACLFAPTETDTRAGYDKALQAVYDSIKGLGNLCPKIIGAEPLGIGGNNLQNYIKALDTNLLYGYAHHLYGSGDYADPPSFLDNLRGIKRDLSNKPRFQTEFCHLSVDDTVNDPINLAWIMQESFVEEEASGYIFWDLAWGNNGGIMGVENPWNKSVWTNNKGYIIKPQYYTLKQYSKFVKSNWVRLGTTVNDNALHEVAFLNTTYDSTSIVIVNSSDNQITTKIDCGEFPGSGNVYQTGAGKKCDSVGICANGQSLDLPGRTVTTVAFARTRPAVRTAFQKFEAEDWDGHYGNLKNETCVEGGMDLGYTRDGCWARYSSIDFGMGINHIEMRLATQADTFPGNIEFHIDKSDGQLIGKIEGSGSGGWQTFETLSNTIEASGVHDLYIVFRKSQDVTSDPYLCNVNWFRFSDETTEVQSLLNKSTQFSFRTAANGGLQIFYNGNSRQDLSIYDLQGKTLFHQQFEKKSNSTVPLYHKIVVIRVRQEEKTFSRLYMRP